MNNKRFFKIASFILLSAYVNLIALSIFHFHSPHTQFESASFYLSPAGVNIPDPFSDGNSNCRVALFTTMSYIGESEIINQGQLFYNASIFTGLEISGIPLQVISNSNSLRAPPLNS